MSPIDKYKKLPTWGKAGALGSLASLISIPLAFYLSSSPAQTQSITGDGNVQISTSGPVSVNTEPDSRKIIRENSIRQLSDDLEKIKNLLPPSRVIGKCMASRGRLSYFEAYELCVTDSKINNSDAQALIEKSISNFEAYFGQKEGLPILDELNEIHRYVYEMGNNTMVYGAWVANACPDAVKFGGKELIEAEAQKNGNTPPKCQLAMSGDVSEVDRDNNNQPKYSALSKGSLHVSQVIAIVPGGDKSIKEFFQAFDSELYDEVLRHIETTKALMLQIK